MIDGFQTAAVGTSPGLDRQNAGACRGNHLCRGEPVTDPGRQVQRLDLGAVQNQTADSAGMEQPQTYLGLIGQKLNLVSGILLPDLHGLQWAEAADGLALGQLLGLLCQDQSIFKVIASGIGHQRQVRRKLCRQQRQRMDDKVRPALQQGVLQITDLFKRATGGVSRYQLQGDAGAGLADGSQNQLALGHGLLIGANTAEEVKITIGCVMERPEEVSMMVKGRDLRTGLPREELVTSTELLETMRRPAWRIVDEILSVGDYKFRQKCEKRMKELLDGGTTLLYVSHSIEEVKRLCDHALWIDKGVERMKGEADEVCDAYMAEMKK